MTNEGWIFTIAAASIFAGLIGLAHRRRKVGARPARLLSAALLITLAAGAWILLPDSVSSSKGGIPVPVIGLVLLLFPIAFLVGRARRRISAEADEWDLQRRRILMISLASVFWVFMLSLMIAWLAGEMKNRTPKPAERNEQEAKPGPPLPEVCTISDVRRYERKLTPLSRSSVSDVRIHVENSPRLLDESTDGTDLYG